MNRKVNSEGEKAGDEGRLNPSIKSCPIKKVEFFLFFLLILIEKRRARKADERGSSVYFPLILLRFVLFAPPGDSVGRE